MPVEIPLLLTVFTVLTLITQLVTGRLSESDKVPSLALLSMMFWMMYLNL